MAEGGKGMGSALHQEESVAEAEGVAASTDTQGSAQCPMGLGPASGRPSLTTDAHLIQAHLGRGAVVKYTLGHEAAVKHTVQWDI